MNIFHLNSRNLRSLTNLLVIITCISVVLLCIRSLTLPSAPDITLSALSSNDNQQTGSILGRLKFGAPDAEGKVEIVIALDAIEVASYLDKKFKEAGSTHQNDSYLAPNVTILLNNEHICANSSRLRYVVHVNSKPEAQALRNVLRQTWANPNLFTENLSKLVFMVGKPLKDVDGKIQAKIESEFALHGDIVQGDFIDTLRNSTLKSVMGLKWVSEFCPQAAYAIKANDETFVDIFELIRLMDKYGRHKWVVMCPLWKENTMPILRDPKKCGAWCVKDSELVGQTHFPQYCASVVSVMSRDLVSRLYRASQNTPFFFISDVYVTGLLPKKLPKSIHYIDMLSSMSLNYNIISQEYINTTAPSKFKITQLDEVVKFHELWKALLGKLAPNVTGLLNDAPDIQS